MEEVKIVPKGKQIEWDYDEEADVLYLSFGKPRPATGIDFGDGIILRYSEKKGEVVGLTIVGIKDFLLKSLSSNQTVSTS